MISHTLKKIRRLLGRVLLLLAVFSCGGCTHHLAPCRCGAPAHLATSELALAPLHGKVRTFEITYTAAVKNIPVGTQQYALWIPLPSDSVQQRIREVKIDSPYPWQITREKKYGNRMIFIEVTHPPTGFFVKISYQVTRVRGSSVINPDTDRAPLAYALERHPLTPLTADVQKSARQIALGKTGNEGKALALRSHTLSFMKYDKSIAGWGQGDYRRACDTGTGNCTDFHWYFITLCRNIGVPARFVMGVTVPNTPAQGEVRGYHCWAYYWNDNTWVPVDISEAEKHPKLFHPGIYYADRVAFSRGRDLILAPPQQAAPVIFFSAPYGEADGKKHRGVHKTIHYQNR